ncbi:MAG TPA: chemotaxis protein CheA, partial [Gemmatimonadaceae bacterium]|nr:chemotaxis protein CheA [Gemmatimonadaceae bacterium]
AATMGYAAVTELSHELETVLDRARRRELTIDSTIIDILLRAADSLERLVELAVAGREGELSIGSLVADLRSLRPMVETSEWAIPRLAAANAAGLTVSVRLVPDAPLRSVRALLIIQAFRKVADVTSIMPTETDLEADRFDGVLTIHCAADAPRDEIERVVRAAGDVEAVEFVEGSAPVIRPSVAMPLPVMAETPSKEAGVRVAPGRGRHVRIDVRRLDKLMNLVGELVVARGRLSQLAGEVGDHALEETVRLSSRLITELRDEITASRMVPVSNVFDRFPRVVRDAARALGKSVEFTVEGRDIELDRSMLDDIADSIVHLLRNSVDHGIEPPEQRVAAGKPAAGTLVLSALRDRSAVVIRVTDDGRGIDRDRVLARAKRDGLVDAAKSDLTEEELLRLLARPGFSTAEQVTEVSGRGVGVDAVYTRVRALGGAMNIRSIEGQGTTMTIRLPLTLAVVRSLLARVADEMYAIPLAHVSETIELTPDIVRTVQGKEVVLARDEVFPLIRLRRLVGLPHYAPASAIDLEQVVVIDVGDRRAGLVIDELTGQEEIVVKQFDAVRDGPPFFGGATLLGDGRPCLIVDVSSLL